MEISFRTATVCHLGNIAYLLKRPLKWDPVKEQFIGDDELLVGVDDLRGLRNAQRIRGALTDLLEQFDLGDHAFPVLDEVAQHVEDLRLDLADAVLTIPLERGVESLNVAASAAICSGSFWRNGR